MEFLKYTAASAVALGLDYSVYWALAGWFGVSIGAAAAIGYGAGLLLAYLLLSNGVFPRRWLAGRRGIEVALFALSGAIGLVLTYVTATLVDRLAGGNLHAAKLSAVAASFVSVYLIRKFIVFRQPGL